MRTPEIELAKKPEIKRGRQVLRQAQNKAVRPYRDDGYANMLNKYGTTHDNSEAYHFEREPSVPDIQLTSLYEGNGLFSKIIDAPAEEALKHGFELNINDDSVDTFVEDALDVLEWENKATTAIKWARLYGGAIIVMLIDDGGGLDEPVNWKNIRSIDELRVFERAIVQPDVSSLYARDFGGYGKANRVSRFGEPEYYYVNSMFGNFKVHESRCLVFRNGVLPEGNINSLYQMWGVPEYVRIKRALRETITAHSDATKLLERSVQAIYSMKNLAQLLATDEGEEQVLKRLEVIDMARGLLNSIAIDADGENYEFKSISFAGVREVIDSTCNMLSALTNIPQTILFGRSPAGMNATGTSDFENYYNFIERIQKLMLKKNLRYLLDIIFRAGVESKELAEEPSYKLTFNPLWSMSEAEQAAVEQQRASTALVKAQTAQLYVGMQAIDPSEVRKKLASDENFNVEDIVEEDDSGLYESMYGQSAGAAEPGAEAEVSNFEQQKPSGGALRSSSMSDNNAGGIKTDGNEANTVGVIVLKDGKILTGVRKSDFYPFTICGAGGHIEQGETAKAAAVREAQEEFSITPTELIPLAVRSGLAKEFGVPAYFLCTEYEGEIDCTDHSEMVAPQMSDLVEILRLAEANSSKLFPPFADSIRVLCAVLGEEYSKNDNVVLPNDTITDIIKESVRNADEFEESDHPRDESGKFAPSGGSEDSPKEGAPTEAKKEPSVSGVSATGANISCTGWSSKEKETIHHGKHVIKENAKLYKGMNDEQYTEHAKDFLKQPCGGDIDGYATADGYVCRYNIKTGEYAKGKPNGVIRTCMVAKCNKKTGEANLKLAQKYFDNLKSTEGI